MNKRLIALPMTALALLTLAGCGQTPTTSPTNNTTVTNSVVTSPASNAVSNTTPKTPSTTTTSVPSNDASQMKLILSKGYTVKGTHPDASVQTASGKTLSAWIGIKAPSDGHNQYVFFFLDGKYLGTDTSKPSVEITSIKAVGHGIAVTYPVYKKTDSFAKATGTPVTITYTWNGSKLVPSQHYPKQFS